MAILRKSLAQREFNFSLMRTCPRKLQLVHPRPLNCTGGSCFQNGRGSISALCPVCDGTGYLTGSQSGDFTQPPYADSCYIYGDLQIGHGLYGSGGDYLRLIADLGKQNIGDATLFTKMWDINHVTGKVIYPIIDASLPRPDQVISVYNQLYNVIREVIAEVGNDQICRIFTLEKGSFSMPGNK